MAKRFFGGRQEHKAITERIAARRTRRKYLSSRIVLKLFEAEFTPSQISQVLKSSRRQVLEALAKGGKIRQPGICEICGSDRELLFDHNHATGTDRGKLCTNCNAGIGMFADSEERLMAAIIYLRRHKAPTYTK